MVGLILAVVNIVITGVATGTAIAGAVETSKAAEKSKHDSERASFDEVGIKVENDQLATSNSLNIHK